MGVADARRALATPALAAGWVAVAVAAVPALLGVSLSPTAQYAPLVASVVVFGLPHGAIDWVALPRAVSGDVTTMWLAVVGALYLVLGGAYAAVWFLWPVPATLAFVALTWFHWGQGDVFPLRALAGADHLDSRGVRAGTLVVRGGLPMLVPLLGHPETYRDVVAAFAAPFGGTVGDFAVFDPGVRFALGVAFAALTAGTLAVGWLVAENRRAWRVDAAETLGLWAFFLLVPPVFAVGVYFCLWHSVRHVARAVELDEGSRPALARGDLSVPLGRFAREAAPLTVAALVLLGALAVVVPDRPTTLSGWTGLYLAFVAIVTLPHVAVVTWMDRAQGILGGGLD